MLNNKIWFQAHSLFLDTYLPPLSVHVDFKTHALFLVTYLLPLSEHVAFKTHSLFLVTYLPPLSERPIFRVVDVDNPLVLSGEEVIWQHPHTPVCFMTEYISDISESVWQQPI